MADSTPNARDAKLIQYLGEAYGNEKRLETALEAHIGMASRTTYKQRLRQHLTETKRHARELERRIKQLGGDPQNLQSLPGAVAEVAGAVVSGAQKATALAKGPVHALRGTGEEEKQLKNAKTEYTEEAQEIATYSALETLATTVGDKDTARIVKGILRDEQRMLAFLQKEIPRMMAAVAKAEIPAAERNASAPRRSTRRTTRSTGGTTSRGTAARKPAARGTKSKSGPGARGASTTRRRATRAR